MAAKKSKPDTITVGPRATDLEARVEGSGLVTPGGQNKKYGEVETPIDKVAKAARNIARTVSGVFAPHPPKASGNSAMDAHRARAHEFDMTEAERARQLKRLDRNIAADKK